MLARSLAHPRMGKMGVRTPEPPLIRHFSRRGSSSPAVSTHLRGRPLSLSPSLSVPALRMRVRLSGRTFSFVRSPFLLVFRLYLFLIARSSSFLSRLRPLRPRTHSLARSLDLPLLLPFLRPIRHHWQFGALRPEAPSRLKTLKMPASARSSSSGIAK